MPFLLKDLWAHYAGQPLTNGCRALKNAMPISPPTRRWSRRFRRAGLNIAGRTNSPEFGSLPTTEPLAWGPTRNPWNLGSLTGWFQWWLRRGSRRGMVPVRPRQRWRRVDPHPGVVLRARRTEAVTGTDHARPVP